MVNVGLYAWHGRRVADSDAMFVMQQDVLMLVCGVATYQTLFFYLLMHRAAWLRAAACGSGYSFSAANFQSTQQF
jgi:hypothetical protein